MDQFRPKRQDGNISSATRAELRDSHTTVVSRSLCD